MLIQDKITVTQIIIGLFAVWFLVRFFYSLYRKKDSVVILVENCKECPFKNGWQTDKINCDLKRIIGARNENFKTQKDLKESCPIKGKLEISISKS